MTCKKVLVVTTRYPFPVRGGDKLRIAEIIKFLSKRNQVDLVSIGNVKKKTNHICNQYIFKNNFLNLIYNILKSLIKKEPLQIGMYKIPQMKKKIQEISNEYDVIIFHLIRSTYYLPKKYHGKKILEMTDLISKNYKTAVNTLSFINPLKYLYNFEKNRLINYELSKIKIFDKVIIVNKKDIVEKNISKNNIFVIGNGTSKKKNIYFENTSKDNIIFFGNINSLANRNACFNFIKEYLPILRKKNIEFKIIGNCFTLLKFLFKIKGVDVISNINELKDYCKNTLAGICNVNIQSGLQNKILDYASIGLPIILNKKSNNFKHLRNKDMLIYKTKEEFFIQLEKLIKNKKIAYRISNNNYIQVQKFYDWNKVLKNYLKIIK